jgi:hypothetical protein
MAVIAEAITSLERNELRGTALVWVGQISHIPSCMSLKLFLEDRPHACVICICYLCCCLITCRHVCIQLIVAKYIGRII